MCLDSSDGWLQSNSHFVVGQGGDWWKLCATPATRMQDFVDCKALQRVESSGGLRIAHAYLMEPSRRFALAHVNFIRFAKEVVMTRRGVPLQVTFRFSLLFW